MRLGEMLERLIRGLRDLTDGVGLSDDMRQRTMTWKAAAALQQQAREIERLTKLTKCDSCGEPFNENGGICEPCHSSALASHIRPLGQRIRELEAERDQAFRIMEKAQAECVALWPAASDWMEEHRGSGKEDRCLCSLCASDHKIYDAIRALQPAAEGGE